MQSRIYDSALCTAVASDTEFVTIGARAKGYICGFPLRFVTATPESPENFVTKRKLRANLCAFMSEQNGKHSSEPSRAKLSSAEIKRDQSASSENLEQSEVRVEENLSAEEQMALYEKALKEDDWGHQPC